MARSSLGSVVLAAALASCGGEASLSGDSECEATARYPDAIGCAYVYGKVTDTNGISLDGVDGLIRLGDECVCSSPRVEVDDNGVYSTIVHRLPRVTGFSDTATGTVQVLASAAKYPRHVTGAAYFDTSRVVLQFVPIGTTPPALQVNLRIPLPRP
ncbi:MAG: hypothetical protein H7066_13025 [Cytophagaceae bacterium]|nr:hypothetical protein [Gemmatimonadaceae bacterium]